MSRILVTFLVGLVAILIGFYQLSLRPKLAILGVGREVRPVGNTRCKVYPDAQACEKIVIHNPTGLVYMACSTPSSRTHWIPTTDRLNAMGKSSSDYVAFFDPSTSRTTRLRIEGFKDPRGQGLSVHGMDVVPSKENPGELIMYLVNHRTPLPPKDPKVDGADSVVEVFRTTPGSEVMRHVRTFEDPVITTPNDILAIGDDDKSFYFTNDHGFRKTGLARRLALDAFFDLGWSNVGYCHAERGCKIVIDNLVSANGITRGKDGRVYVTSPTSGRVYVLDRKADNSLVIADVITHSGMIDNLSTDQNGTIWGAGLVHILHFSGPHHDNPEIKTPSSALRITVNNSGTPREKYRVEKVFEDDGEFASGSTSAAYDAERKKLYLHGIASPHLTVCDI
ncbi:calcium-dependent phosphotriesterase [Fomitiporia mediterranea MF3/22]|uniref:calcium-dependent phosphotriesterase n=1 Tax=Fomitiporia mediterranea (strain MF3/22) TaxID=694068 RepID=UPI00044076B8|nr:calcium-dependent phosphotriesterase [Fomitiporia mediterranea MF3/22]EJD03198.1 calcium-dependent phosphotriesterase [Fomitiporia mediterranea MF3/22]